MSNQSLFRLINIVKRGQFFYLGKVGCVTTYVHVKDVANALLILATNPRAKGEVYNLSFDCTLEDLINHVASLLHVNKPRTRIPGPIVRIPLRILSSLLKRFIHIPKLDSLVMRTRYPTTKIESELDFVFSMPLPDAIKELTKKIV